MGRGREVKELSGIYVAGALVYILLMAGIRTVLEYKGIDFTNLSEIFLFTRWRQLIGGVFWPIMIALLCFMGIAYYMGWPWGEDV